MRKKQWKIYLERSLASGLPFKELVHEIVWVTVVEGSVGLGGGDVDEVLHPQ